MVNIITVHHDCSCRLGKSHPRGQNFYQGLAREVADFSDVIKLWRRHTSLICHIACMSILVIKTKIFVKNWKSPAANIRKMLLMKDYNSSPWLSILTRGVGISIRDEASLIPGRNSSPEGEISLSYMDWLMMDYFFSHLYIYKIGSQLI